MRYQILPLLLVFMLIGAGCNSTTDTSTLSNKSAQETRQLSTSSTDEKNSNSIAIDDISGFLLNFQETIDMLAGEGDLFRKASIDPNLRAKYMVSGSDIPLMRFLGKKGLNNIESKNLQASIVVLKKQKIHSNFGESIDRLDKSLRFLKRFYSEIVDLQSFEDFKMDMADFLAYQDALLEVGDVFKREYGVLKYEYPDFDYQMTDSLARLIIQLYSASPQPSVPLPPSFQANPSIANAVQTREWTRECEVEYSNIFEKCKVFHKAPISFRICSNNINFETCRQKVESCDLKYACISKLNVTLPECVCIKDGEDVAWCASDRADFVKGCVTQKKIELCYQETDEDEFALCSKHLDVDF